LRGVIHFLSAFSFFDLVCVALSRVGGNGHAGAGDQARHQWLIERQAIFNWPLKITYPLR